MSNAVTCLRKERAVFSLSDVVVCVKVFSSKVCASFFGLISRLEVLRYL